MIFPFGAGAGAQGLLLGKHGAVSPNLLVTSDYSARSPDSVKCTVSFWVFSLHPLSPPPPLCESEFLHPVLAVFELTLQTSDSEIDVPLECWD